VPPRPQFTVANDSFGTTEVPHESFATLNFAETLSSDEVKESFMTSRGSRVR